MNLVYGKIQYVKYPFESDAPLKVKETRLVTRVMISIFFSFFVLAPCSAQITGYTTLAPPITDGPTAATTTAATTTAAPYCDAEKCERHSVLILDLEQKVNDLAKGFETLQTQNDELKSENEEIKAEIGELKTENNDLRDDVTHLQGSGLYYCNCMKNNKFIFYSTA